MTTSCHGRQRIERTAPRRWFAGALLCAVSLVVLPVAVAWACAPQSASLAFDRDSYKAADAVGLIGSGFTPNTPVALTLQPPSGAAQTVDARAQTNSQGYFETSFALPPDAPPGDYVLQATTNTITARDTFEVVAESEVVPTPLTPQPPPAPPSTHDSRRSAAPRHQGGAQAGHSEVQEKAQGQSEHVSSQEEEAGQEAGGVHQERQEKVPVGLQHPRLQRGCERLFALSNTEEVPGEQAWNQCQRKGGPRGPACPRELGGRDSQSQHDQSRRGDVAIEERVATIAVELGTGFRRARRAGPRTRDMRQSGQCKRPR